MKKMYQTEWFGIHFSDFSELSLDYVADRVFYDKFYREFYQRYHSYAELPSDWRKGKDEIARHLYDVVKDKLRVLSIGCGNGYIENSLLCFIKEDEKLNLVAVEPSIAASQWLSNKKVKLLHGFFPDVLNCDRQFDFAYASGVDYVFNDAEYKKFLQSVYDFGIKDFLLTEVIIPDEGRGKDLAKKLLSYVGMYEYGQFWGYLRTINEHKKFLREVGFQNMEVGKYKQGTYWIRATHD